MSKIKRINYDLLKLGTIKLYHPDRRDTEGIGVIRALHIPNQKQKGA